MRKLVVFLAFAFSLSVAFPQSNTATVYVYRPHNAYWGALGHPFVYLDGSQMQRITNGSFLAVTVPIGQHQLAIGDFQIGRLIDFEPGKSYYFVATFHKSVMAKDRPMWSLEPSDSGDAALSMAKLKRIDVK